MSRRRRAVDQEAPLLGIEARGYEKLPVDAGAWPDRNLVGLSPVALGTDGERQEEAVAAIALPEVQTEEERPILLCVGLGHLKDGRHVAFEAEVQGGKVLEWRPLCAHTHVSGPERAWWQVAYAKLYVRRKLSETEQAANVRDTRGVLPEHFEHGLAVAIHTQGKKTAALAMRLEGLAVTEPEVLTVGPRDFCWIRIDTWVGLNMLPRRKM